MAGQAPCLSPNVSRHTPLHSDGDRQRNEYIKTFESELSIAQHKIRILGAMNVLTKQEGESAADEAKLGACRLNLVTALLKQVDEKTLDPDTARLIQKVHGAVWRDDNLPMGDAILREVNRCRTWSHVGFPLALHEGQIDRQQGLAYEPAVFVNPCALTTSRAHELERLPTISEQE
jgi:hypothetical protein